MDKRFEETVVITLIAGILIFGSTANTVVEHEDAHSEIYKHYGVDSEITYGFMYLSGSTLADRSYFNISHDSRQTMNMLQAQNEIIGYNVSSLSSSIILAGLLISLSVIMAQKEDYSGN